MTEKIEKFPENMTKKEAWLHEIRFLKARMREIQARMDVCLAQIEGNDNDTIRLIYDNAGTYEAIKRLRPRFPGMNLLDVKKELDKILTR